MLLQKLFAIDFSKHTVNWFKSYLSIRSFLVNLGNNFSRPASEFEKWRAIRASVSGVLTWVACYVGGVGGVLAWVTC